MFAGVGKNQKRGIVKMLVFFHFCRKNIHKNGFSFLDVLIGVFILSCGIAAFAGMQARASRDAALAQAVFGATFLARSELDDLATRSYGDCSPSEEKKTLGRTVYTLRTKVAERADLGIKNIELFISWGKNHEQKYRLTKVKND